MRKRFCASPNKQITTSKNRKVKIKSALEKQKMDLRF